MKKLVHCVVCATAFAAAASEVFVAPHAVKTVEVGTDAVQADRVAVGSGGTLRKTGAGTLTLPLAKLAQGWSADLEVAEGGLELQGGAASVFEYADVSNTLAIAADWFDTAKADSFVTDGQGRITDWLDVRETGNETAGYQLVRATVNQAVTNLYPELRTSAAYGKKGLYFHGYHSGCWMDFLNPSGASVCRWAYHVFAVQGYEADKSFGCLFGARNSSAAAYPQYFGYCPGDAGGGPRPIWTYYSADIPAVYTGRMYLNGRQVDAFDRNSTTECPAKGFSLFESEQLHVPSIIGCLFNDRDYVNRQIAGMNYNQYAGIRQGGDYVCELIVFTNKLAAAERLKVESYLMNKWFGAQTPPTVNVMTADGSTLNLPQGQGTTVKVSGAGVLRKTGDSDEVLSFESGEEGFTGSLRLEGGAATVYAAMSLEAAPGETVTAADEYFGPHFAKTAAAKPTDFVKEGNGTVRVTGDFAEENLRLRVNAGELALTAKVRGRDAAVPDSRRVFGTIPNASFEEGMSATQYKDIASGSAWNGWHCEIPTGQSGMVFMWNGTVSVGSGRSSSTWGLPPVAPDGKVALVVKQRAAAWTEVTVPEDGVYELSFLCSARQGYIGLPLRVKIGTEAANLTDLGCCRCMANDWEYYRYHYRTPALSAGTTYQLWFKPVDDALDRASLIDAVTLVKEDLSVDGVWRLPNGDFSDVSGDYAVFSEADQKEFKASNAAALVGWTCVQPTAPVKPEYDAVTMCTLFMRKPWGTTVNKSYDWWSGRYFNNRYKAEAGVQLQLCLGGSASTTFTPPAGRFYLRGQMGLMPLHSTSGDLVDYRATITPQGGSAIDLGTISRDWTNVMRDETFPVPFVADGATPVTLTVWVEMRAQTGCNDLQANVTDYRLVAAERAAGVNLVENGDFETDGTWTYVSRRGTDYLPCRHTHTIASATSWGVSLYKGSPYSLRMTADGFATQPLSFPQAGDYSLTYAARSRVGWGSPTSHGPDGLRFFYARGGVTNVIEEYTPSTTNYAERTCTFRVAEAGDYVFGVEGVIPPTASKPDVTTFVDGIVVALIAYAAATPGLSEHARVTVAAGAKLRLDFPGTNQVAGVRLGGKHCSGVVSAETDPDFVSGPGALLAVPDKGAVIIVR